MTSLASLKNKLIESSNLSDIMDCFLNLTETNSLINDPSFSGVEETSEAHPIRKAIDVAELTICRFLNKKISFNHRLFNKVNEEAFYHGFCISNELEIPLTLFYFQDIQIGLISLASLNGDTELFRFSLAEHEEMAAMH